MGDYASASLEIAAIPWDTETIRAVGLVVAEWFNDAEDYAYDADLPPLELRSQLLGDWEDESANLMICEELGDALADLGVEFRISQAQIYEYSGTTAVCVPGVGYWCGATDGYGSAVIEETTILSMIEKHQKQKDIHRAVRAYFGTEVTDEYARRRKVEYEAQRDAIQAAKAV